MLGIGNQHSRDEGMIDTIADILNCRGYIKMPSPTNRVLRCDDEMRCICPHEANRQ